MISIFLYYPFATVLECCIFPFHYYPSNYFVLAHPPKKRVCRTCCVMAGTHTFSTKRRGLKIILIYFYFQKEIIFYSDVRCICALIRLTCQCAALVVRDWSVSSYLFTIHRSLRKIWDLEFSLAIKAWYWCNPTQNSTDHWLNQIWDGS